VWATVGGGLVVALLAGCAVACGSSSAKSNGGRDGGPDGAAPTDGGVDSQGPRDSGGPSDAPPTEGSSSADANPPPDSGLLPTCGPYAVLPVRTPTYYVDFVGGSDGADGKSKATAWKHAPGDTNASATPAATTLTAGDVVLFKGGVPYYGSVTVMASGTAQAPIVLEGGAQQGWGSGNAIVDGQQMRTVGISLSGTSYVVVEGFEVRSFDKTQSSTGIDVSGGSNNTVAGNQLHDIYYPQNPNPGTTTWEQQWGNGISVTNSSGTAVTGNTVQDCGNAGISFSADAAEVDGGQVVCNAVTNMNWGIVSALGDSNPGTHMTGVTIAHNYIHDFNHYEVCASWHRDGIFVFARPDNATTTIDHFEIADNYFEDTLSPDFGSTAWIYVEFVCTDFNIHHNILNASRAYYGIRILGDGFQVQGNHILANNVIANKNGMGSYGLHIMQSSGAQLTNNIFYDDDTAYFIATDSMSGFSGDYDLLFATDATKNIVTLDAGPAASPGGTSYDLAGLQAAGYEKHGIVADPMWSVPYASIAADPTGFKPVATSPAKDSGKMLTYTQDFAGVAIPEGAGPDIGAFEQ
jgi:parallel beta-helix repeat protein